jgi:hypothetical protein
MALLVASPPVREVDVVGADAHASGPSEDAALPHPPAEDAVDAAPSDVASNAAPESAAPEAPPIPSPSLANGGAVEPHPAVVGGYWDMETAHGREPDDGREHIIVGSILLPIGTIAASTSAATIWLSAPGHCKERWASLGGTPTSQQCRGTYVFGIIRVAYGSLMMVTGATLLGIGMHRKEKHRKWSRRQSFTPYFDGRGGGLAWTLRFGARG